MNVILEMMLVFAKGIAAGIAIGLGGFLFIGSKWAFSRIKSSTDYSEFGNVIGSTLFSVGLLIVCSLKLMLYTGKIGLTFEVSQSIKHYVSLVVMLIANVCSAYGLGLLLHTLMKSKASRYVDIATNVALAKLKLSALSDYVKCSMQSIFCGSCVHLGVKCFVMFDGRCRGVIITIFAVLMFVYSGFQHCIANSFYFGFANEFRKEVFINVAICIIGNSLGTIPISLFTQTFRKVEAESSDSSISNIQFSSNDTLQQAANGKRKSDKKKHIDTETESSTTYTEA